MMPVVMILDTPGHATRDCSEIPLRYCFFAGVYCISLSQQIGRCYSSLPGRGQVKLKFPILAQHSLVYGFIFR